MTAFALAPSGPPAPCGFPGCVLESFHDGEHEFPKPKPKFAPERIHKCEICGLRFVIYGEQAEPSLLSEQRTCGSQACILALASREAGEVSLICRCPQRDYPHELSVHSEIRAEWWAYKRNPFWPWSLMMSKREEPSTERKAA